MGISVACDGVRLAANLLPRQQANPPPSGAVGPALQPDSVPSGQGSGTDVHCMCCRGIALHRVGDGISQTSA